MSEDKQRVLTLFGVIGAILIWFAVLIPHTYIWEGEGSVSIFPVGSDSKNYRLPAEMNITKKQNGWGLNRTNEYVISKVTWPNGGYSTFSDCTVKDDGHPTCVTDDGDEYSVEVNSIPDMPDADIEDY